MDGAPEVLICYALVDHIINNTYFTYIAFRAMKITEAHTTVVPM